MDRLSIQIHHPFLSPWENPPGGHGGAAPRRRVGAPDRAPRRQGESGGNVVENVENVRGNSEDHGKS